MDMGLTILIFLEVSEEGLCVSVKRLFVIGVGIVTYAVYESVLSAKSTKQPVLPLGSRRCCYFGEAKT
jgi:hypothetical protein